MRDPLVITSGRRYTDIDALAGAVAYAEAARLTGASAHAVLPGPLNASAATVAFGDIRFTRVPPDLASGARYAIVDVSDPYQLPGFVRLDRVEEVYDHHEGFRSYWSQGGTRRVVIEQIGAAATLIWERIEELGVVGQLGAPYAAAISKAILSNTVGFRFALTQARDHQAFAKASARAGLPIGWEDDYFDAVERHIQHNLQGAIALDTKEVALSAAETVTVGQLEVTDGKLFVNWLQTERSGTHLPDLLIIVGRKQEQTYLLTSSDIIRQRLEVTLQIEFTKYLAVLPTVMLRKALVPIMQGLT